MRCIRYWPVVEIDGGGHGGSTSNDVCGVNTTVEGREGEIGREQDLDPQNRELSAGDSISWGG